MEAVKALALALLLAWPARAAGFKVLTLNAAGLPVIHPRVEARMHAIAALIKQGGYDLVALQETWRDQDAETLARESGLPYRARFPRRVSLGTGLTILSRFQVLEQRQTVFTCRPSALRFYEGESIANKGALLARVLTPQGPLDVYSTHLISDYPWADYRKLRLTQIYELSETIARESAGRPFVLLGDMNVNPENPQYRILVDLLGLQDACMSSGQDVCGKTNPRERIDHVFLPRGRRFATARVALVGDLSHERMDYSDHYAVEADIDARALSLRLKPDPARRLAALRQVDAAISRMMRLMMARRRDRSWIPVYGFSLALRYEHQLRQLSWLRSRIETDEILLASGRPR